MRIEYITQARMPTEKAHGLQIANMCGAFAELGHDVNLSVPDRGREVINETVWAYYGLKKNFAVRYLRAPDLVTDWGKLGPWVYWLHSILFFLSLFAHRPAKGTLIYTRTAEIAWLYKVRGYRVACEIHDWPESHVKLFTFLLRWVDLLPCNSEGTEKVCRAHGLTRTMVAHNGIDLEMFLEHFERTTEQKRLGIPLGKKVVMYAGSLEAWKGVDVLGEASRTFSPDTLAVVIGGRPDQVAVYRSKYPTALFLGERPYRELAANQAAADVLVVPNVPVSVESIEYTSPIKLFAHMASGIPVIVSDLPSLRRVASDDAVFFVPPGNAEALKDQCQALCDNPELGKTKTEKARAIAMAHSWEARASLILESLPG